MKPTCLKKICRHWAGVAALLFLTRGAWASGYPPIYEAFPSGYTDGLTLRASGPATFWDSGNTINDITIQSSSALKLPGLFQAPGAKGIHMPPNESVGSKFVDHTFGSNPSAGSIFISFLFKMNAAPATNRAFINVHSASGSGGGSGGILLWVDPAGKLQASKGNVNAGIETATNGTPPALTVGDTNLIVASYTFSTNSGNDDLVDVWVNPASSSFGTATPPAFTFEIGSGKSDAAQLKGIQILGGLALASGGLDADLTALRCATNWTGVVPGISASPANTTSYPGGTATLNVTGGGNLLAYQWQISTNSGANWNNVSTGSGGNTASYTTPVLALPDSGSQYRCLLTNTETLVATNSFTASTSTTISAAATLTVATCSSAGVSTNPANQSVCAGGAAAFNVVASGLLPAYQWQASADNGGNWNSISGATAATFFTNAPLAANSNLFRCVINVACDSSAATSAPALLLVNALPAGGGIASAVICSNSGILLTLTNATDSPQWQVSTNNLAFADVPGATNPAYTTPSLSQKTYYRAVSVNLNSCTATSSVAVITFNAVSATNFNFTATNGQPAVLPIATVLAHAGSLQGAVSLAAVSATTSPGGLPVTTNATDINIAAATANQTFTCTVADVCGDTSVATVTLHVINADYPKGHFNAFTGGGPYSAAMLFYGTPNTAFHVQRTTNLLDWTALGPVAADGFGDVSFTDTNAPYGPAFYRLIFP